MKENIQEIAIISGLFRGGHTDEKLRRIGTKQMLSVKKRCLPKKGESAPTLVKDGKGNFSHVTFNEKGDKLLFLYCEKSKENEEESTLWLYSNNNGAREIVNKATDGIPEGWRVSPHYRPWFSKDCTRIYLGTAPAPMQKDTTILDSNRPNVEVWNWDEPVQYTIQKHNVNSDSKRSYIAVYNIVGKLSDFAFISMIFFSWTFSK